MAELVIEKFFPGRGNTRTLIERYVAGDGEKGGVPAAGALYVAPTRRKARQVRDMLMERAGALLGEAVVTFDDLVDAAGRKAADGPVIGDSKKRVLIEDALLDEFPGGRPFGAAAEFPGTVRAISQLIAELKQNGIMSHAELEKRARAAGLKGKIFSDLAAVYRAYAERQTPGGNAAGKFLLDAEDLAARAAGYIEKNGLEGIYPGRRAVVFDGFYDFNELQKNVVAAVARTAEKTVFAVEAGGRTEEERARYRPVFRLADETLGFLRALGISYKEKWNEPAEELRPAAARNLFVSLADFSPGAERGAPVKFLRARDREEEVRLIAESIKRRMAEAGPGGFDPRGTAVIFPALEKYAPYVREWFPRCGVPFRIGAGTPLNSAAASDMFLAMLEAAESGFARAVLFRLLSFPFVSFRKLDGEFGGDGIWFRPGEFDTLAREAQIVGGAPGQGAEEWKDKFRKMLESLKSRMEGAAAGGDDPEKEDREKLARKYSRVDFYARCFDRIAEWYGPLLKDEKIAPAEYFERLRELLENFGVEEKVYLSEVRGVSDARRAENVRALGGLLEALEECRSALGLVKRARSMTPAGYGDFVRAAVHGGKLPERGAGEGVAVMGAYETRGLRFDAVYLGGLADGEFPRAREAPFLFRPKEREALGLRSIRNEVAEERMLFFRLLACAPELTVSYPMWEGGKECLRSDFLEALGAGGDEDNGNDEYRLVEMEEYRAPAGNRVYSVRRWLEGTGAAALGGRGAEEWKRLMKSPALRGRDVPFRNMLAACGVEGARGGAEFSAHTGAVRSAELRAALAERFLASGREFSATQLEMYARCPFHFFANYVLKLGAPEEVEEELTPVTVGSLLHDILCGFYAGRVPAGGGPAERVTRDNLGEAEKQILKIAEERMEGFAFTGVFWERAREGMLRGLPGRGEGAKPGVLKDFLLREADLPAALRPEFFEAEFSDRAAAETAERPPFPGWKCAVGAGQAFFRGRVDRIDTAEIAGKKYWLVLDYKSGKHKDINLTGRGIDFQLPLYLFFIRALMGPGDEYAGGAYDYIHGKPADRGRRGVFARKKFVSKNPAPEALFVTGARKGILEDGEFADTLRDLEGRVAKVVRSMVSGWFHESPLDGKLAGCGWCDFAALCRGGGSAERLENLKGKPEWDEVYVPGGVVGEEKDG